MDAFRIQGQVPLNGDVTVGGSKNCALPVLFATLLGAGKHHVTRVPKLRDMDSTLQMLVHFGAQVDQRFTQRFGSDWTIDAANIGSFEAPYDFVRKMRASVLCLGPLVARFGRGRASLPGGCAIGARPINLHLMAFEKLGARVTLEKGYVDLSLPVGRSSLKGAEIIFPLVSVGATENALMAATLADGVTRIENAAREPEVRDLGVALQSMGAKITGLGTSTIEITGVSTLGGMQFQIPPDRIEAATYLFAGPMTGGKVRVIGAREADLGLVIESMRRAGLTVECFPDGIQASASGPILPVSLQTAPFPGFPTDLQAQWTALMTQAKGTSTLTESIFENRLMHVPELCRMGARIEIAGNTVRIEGTPGALEGAPVMATDLRASASLVLAALCAKGESTVRRIYHLDRGYEAMEVKLEGLGARVERIAE